jgi:hypothetical protein
VCEGGEGGGGGGGGGGSGAGKGGECRAADVCVSAEWHEQDAVHFLVPDMVRGMQMGASGSSVAGRTPKPADQVSYKTQTQAQREQQQLRDNMAGMGL